MRSLLAAALCAHGGRGKHMDSGPRAFPLGQRPSSERRRNLGILKC